MSNKSIFSIINVESAPSRVPARPAAKAPARPAPAKPRAAGRPAPARSPRSFSLANASYERVLVLLVLASFAAYIGAYLLGTALELLAVLAVPALLVIGVGLVVRKVIAARREAAAAASGAPLVDAAHRLKDGR